MALNKIETSDWDRLSRYLAQHRSKSDAYMLIHLMMFTGARTDEIIRIRPCDIKPVTGKLGSFEVNIFHGAKGSNSRRRVLDAFKSDNLIESLLLRASVMGLKSNQAFIRLVSGGKTQSGARLMRYQFANICEVLFKDSSRYSLKSIRHTFARKIYNSPKAGKDPLRFASKALGHKSIQSTMHYLDAFTDGELQSVIDDAI